MKFNVDGISGVLRDENGLVKVFFSKAIGVGDANRAKVRAIREAFLIFSIFKWV